MTNNLYDRTYKAVTIAKSIAEKVWGPISVEKDKKVSIQALPWQTFLAIITQLVPTIGSIDSDIQMKEPKEPWQGDDK